MFFLSTTVDKSTISVDLCASIFKRKDFFMITTEPTMTNLFLQLGLDASEQGIADFIKTNQLPNTVTMCDAPYWNASQRELLSDQLKSDAPWALIVDQLSQSLHSDAEREARKTL